MPTADCDLTLDRFHADWVCFGSTVARGSHLAKRLSDATAFDECLRRLLQYRPSTDRMERCLVANADIWPAALNLRSGFRLVRPRIADAVVAVERLTGSRQWPQAQELLNVFKAWRSLNDGAMVMGWLISRSLPAPRSGYRSMELIATARLLAGGEPMTPAGHQCQHAAAAIPERED